MVEIRYSKGLLYLVSCLRLFFSLLKDVPWEAMPSLHLPVYHDVAIHCMHSTDLQNKKKIKNTSF